VFDSPHLLLASVRARLDRARTIQEAIDCDGLTGLLNRSAFFRSTRRHGKRPAKPRRSTLIMVDIDRFKQINDQYGHLTGDTVLRNCATLLRSHLRPSDVVSRFGGEEFAILAGDINEEDAVRLADRLRMEFAEMQHTTSSGSLIQATFSAGVSIYKSGWSYEQWVDSADQALYVAKRSGRNRVHAAGSNAPNIVLLKSS
jgi:diguanylate cyclase (GGDEF)-like protein